MRQEPALPGTPRLDTERIKILGRAKAEPVLFLEPPQFEAEVPTFARQLRHSLANAPYPSERLKLLLNAIALQPELGRQVLLRNGYLYAEDAELAFALVNLVRLEHLFDSERIFIQRGDRVFEALKLPSRGYQYLGGPESGKPARLILFDRVSSHAPRGALHVDLRSLRDELHFESIQIEHRSPRHLLAKIGYGDLVLPAVISHENGRARLDCEVVPPDRAKDLALFRDRGARKLRVVRALQREIQRQIEEQLPFDEPHTEYGQQDGLLRRKWRYAYDAGEQKYQVNGDEYSVFDDKGRPIVPQVCVDFLTDTFERAGGKWFLPKGEPPGVSAGLIDFTQNHVGTLRQVPAFIELTRNHPEWFDVYEQPERERIQFRRRNEFYQYLASNTARYQAGDIVIIRGYTPFEKPWQTRVMHYHSFFVYENDPLTGFPLAIVGNPGRPTIRVWDVEARRTPKRSIWFRIRPKLHWAETHFKLDTVSAGPAPLSVGPL